MRIISVISLFAFIFTLVSCGRKGCTDKYADNYCSKCKRDDGSCVYTSKCIFWHNKATNDSLIAHNKTAIYYAVEGIIVGQFYPATASVSNYPPECSANGMASKSLSLKNTGSHFESYQIVDQNQNVLWSGIIDFNANSPCIFIQQIWNP